MRFQRIAIYALIALFLAAFLLVCAGFGDCFNTCAEQRW